MHSLLCLLKVERLTPAIFSSLRNASPRLRALFDFAAHGRRADGADFLHAPEPSTMPGSFF
jgi:hypothetical protein